jgi:hypothetical protein
MRRSTLWTCALLAIATSGCKQINEQVAAIKEKIGGRRAVRPAPAKPAPTQPAPSPAAPASGTPPPAERARPAVTTEIPTRPRASRDVPYESPDTGTIAPGMSERQVYTLWGPPVAVRRQGEFTYLFFRNGCEYTCGTEDVVTLQNGQVVDAVLRWPGHGYSGESSSPPGTVPLPNPGGDTLALPPSTP